MLTGNGKRNKDSFAQNTLVTGVSQVLSFGLGLLTSVVVARGLGPEGKGLYTLALLVPSLMITLCHLGIQWATAYYVAQRRYSIPDILGSNVWLAVWLGTGSIALSVLLVVFFNEWLVPGVPQSYLLIALLVIPAEMLFSYLRYLLLGLKHIYAFNLINVAQKGILLVFMAIAVWITRGGVVSALAAGLCSWVVANVVLFSLTKRASGGAVFTVNWSYVKEAVFYGLKAHIGNIFWFLTHRVDLFLVNGYLGSLAVGYYSLSVGLGEQLWMISQAASTVLFPIIAAEKDENRRRNLTPVVTRTAFLTTSLFALIMAILSPWLVKFLYSETFLPSVRPLQGLLPGIVALSAARVLANDIAGRGRPLLNTYVVAAGFIVNILLNLVLIPSYGILGAAIASSASYTLILAIRLFLYCRLSGNRWAVVVLPQRGDFSLYLRTGKAILEWTKAKLVRYETHG